MTDTLTARLRKAIEFNTNTVQTEFSDHEWAPNETITQRYVWQEGARYQHALTAPIFEELLKCVEALERIYYYSSDDEGPFQDEIAGEALAALEGKLDTKGEEK